MLTIGQLAEHAGVTIRTVRHYHQCGLLPEPSRDASGYRRYDAQALVDLIRIKTLAGAGVPLSHVHELMHATPDAFAAAVTEIDKTLVRRIDELADLRRRIAALAAGDSLFLPPSVAAILHDLRASGHSDRLLRIERDTWIMLYALAPHSIPEWVAAKRSAMADPHFRHLYLALDHALDWDPADPRLRPLAAEVRAYSSSHAGKPVPLPSKMPLMLSHVAAHSPAWSRLAAMLA
jgi:DNA-binding transcriptional MerR regulator